MRVKLNYSLSIHFHIRARVCLHAKLAPNLGLLDEKGQLDTETFLCAVRAINFRFW